MSNGKHGASPAECLFLLCPVKGDSMTNAGKKLHDLLDQGWYVFGHSTPGRTRLKLGDELCFYQADVGVVAEAMVASEPEMKFLPFNPDPDRYPWAVQVQRVRYFSHKPTVVADATLRSRLDIFRGKDIKKTWGWFVQGTHIVSEHDFRILTGRSK